MTSLAQQTNPQLLFPEEVRSRYRDFVLLGQGGMGQVWKAHDTFLELDVALKLVRPDIAENTKLLKRFRREAQALVRLHHPNVVRILDYHEQGGLRFYVMEYVAGESLSELLSRRDLAPKEAVALIRQAAAGLAAAHELSIVHRDIKPANLVVAGDGSLRLVDFGLVRFDDGIREATQLTQTGHFMGTLAYLTPEQLLEVPAGAPADVYQMGLVLYEALVGRHAFHDWSLPDILQGAAFGAICPPADARPQIDGSLSAMVMDCLAVQADARPSAASLRDFLEAWESDPAHGMTPPPGARRRERGKAAPHGKGERPRFRRSAETEPSRLHGTPPPLGSTTKEEIPPWKLALGLAALVGSLFLLSTLFMWKLVQILGLNRSTASHSITSAGPSQAPLPPSAAPSTPATLDDSLPRVLLDVEPADAVVEVNGRRVPPELWQACPVEGGSLQLSVRSPGYVSHHETFSMASGQDRTVMIRLSPLRGKHPAGTVKKAAFGYDFVYVPPGVFAMGCPSTELGAFSWEGPPRQVVIERGFWISSTEVLLKDWVDVMKGHSEYELFLQAWKNFAEQKMLPPRPEDLRPDMPALCVSWEAAGIFCERLRKREGKIYRLPREREWECACRAGSAEARYGPLDEVARWKGFVGPVKSRRPNAWGLYDMLGNVWEWCLDVDGALPISNRVRSLQGRGTEAKIFRGGGAWGDARYCRAASRSGGEADRRAALVGFRLVLED